MPERPNILLIVFDTARADAFEPFGAAAGSSPAFADLAARGFAHDAAYANASWTVPSHASLFTGLLPADVGLLQAPGSRPEGCRPELEARSERLLQTVLGEAGLPDRRRQLQPLDRPACRASTSASRASPRSTPAGRRR